VGPKTDELDRLDAEETMEESPDVEATRAQIEQTRGEMGETIEAIREKLNPHTLAEQAKETVSDITSNVMDKARATAHDVVQEAKETVTHVMHEAKETVHDVVQEAKETLPTMTSNAAHQAVSGAVNEAKEAVGSAVSTARHAMGEAAGTAKDAGATLMDLIRRNPIPSALIGVGLGWLWASNRGRGMAMQQSDRAELGYGSAYDEANWGRGSGATYHGRDNVGHAASAPMAGIQSGAREVVGDVKESVGRAADRVQETVGEIKERVQGSLTTATARVQETAGELGSRTGEYARGMASGCQALIEERPLAAGAIALGLGAAIGLLVPGTYRENQLMGEARDQIVDKVQDTAQDLATRAQIVAEEAIDTAAAEARNQGLTG